jgi:hypothetical protein
MKFRLKLFVVAAAALVLPAMSHAQFNFNLAGQQVQVHSFASQGFAKTDENNFLTMNTESGSFALTDGGVNMSSQLTDRFRLGAQMYVRDIGQLGQWDPKLDWAYADYRFNHWIGIRAGKVKTVLGLYNDTQDVDALQTFALLPQGIYAVDLRDNFVAHTGLDFYGEVPAFKKSRVRYTVYAGMRPDDPDGGYYYGAKAAGTPLSSLGGNATGLDLRWETPVHGLTVGISQMAITAHATGNFTKLNNAPFFLFSRKPEEITSFYLDYAVGKWHMTGEGRRDKGTREATVMGKPVLVSDPSTMGGYGTVAYRVAKCLELGTYHSWFYVDSPRTAGSAANHIFDQAVTARFDLNRFWYAKIEGHFMDGYGDTYSSHGFYTVNNPKGLKPTTNMILIRTGVSF